MFYSPSRSYASGYQRHKSRSNAYILSIAKWALKIITGASITTSAILALQLAWIILKTPRLPPPQLSGVDFVRRGRVVKVGDDDESDDDVEMIYTAHLMLYLMAM